MSNPIPGTDNYEVALIAAAAHFADKFVKDFHYTFEYNIEGEGDAPTGESKESDGWLLAFNYGFEGLKSIYRDEPWMSHHPLGMKSDE